MKKTKFAVISLLLISAMLVITSCSSRGKDNTPKINYEKLNCRAVGEFNDGVQWVTREEVTYNSDATLYGLIDTKGNFLIEMTSEYTDVDPFYNDAAWVEVGNNQYRAIDKSGNYLTGIYKEADRFSDDVAWVKNSSGNWMVIDKSDNEVFTYDEYDGVRKFSQFSEGKCIVVLSENNYSKKGTYVLDKSGGLIPLEVDVISHSLDIGLGKFENGYALCGDKWGEVNGNVFCNLVYVKNDGSVLALKTGSGGGLLAQRFYSAPAFENIEICAAGNFVDGKANIIFKGKDELYYKIQIDESGNFLDEPKNGLSNSDLSRALMNLKSPENSNITISDITKIFSGNGFIE